jgi:hypothetical protein
MYELRSAAQFLKPYRAIIYGWNPGNYVDVSIERLNKVIHRIRYKKT